MDKVKKISIALIMIILIIGMFTNKTYAVLNCNVSLTTPKNKVTYKEQFSVYVKISNLQTTKGIIAVGGMISYDENSLTLVDIEGENKWSNPFYNSSNGKITSFKNELSTSNENVFKIIFQVNEKGKTKNNAWIKIDNFEISDGDEENNCGGNSLNIKIEELNNGNSEDKNQTGNNQNSNSESNIQGENNIANNSGGNSQISGNTQIKKPNTVITPQKPSADNSTNEQSGNLINENSNDIDTNTIEENPTNIIENNGVQNISEKEIKAKENKRMFYLISGVALIAIIGMLFIIIKYWKVN